MAFCFLFFIWYTYFSIALLKRRKFDENKNAVFCEKINWREDLSQSKSVGINNCKRIIIKLSNKYVCIFIETISLESRNCDESGRVTLWLYLVRRPLLGGRRCSLFAIITFSVFGNRRTISFESRNCFKSDLILCLYLREKIIKQFVSEICEMSNLLTIGSESEANPKQSTVSQQIWNKFLNVFPPKYFRIVFIIISLPSFYIITVFFLKLHQKMIHLWKNIFL